MVDQIFNVSVPVTEALKEIRNRVLTTEEYFDRMVWDLPETFPITIHLTMRQARSLAACTTSVAQLSGLIEDNGSKTLEPKWKPDPRSSEDLSCD